MVESAAGELSGEDGRPPLPTDVKILVGIDRRDGRLGVYDQVSAVLQLEAKLLSRRRRVGGGRGQARPSVIGALAHGAGAHAERSGQSRAPA